MAMNQMGATRQVAGAGESFAELYEEHLPKVFRYMQYRVNDIQLAEDLTSATFEKALVNFARYSRDRAAFSTWLFSIARNTVIDHYRVKAREHTAPLEAAAQVSSREPSPEQLAVRKEEIGRLSLCLAGLSADEQEIVHLKFGGELNNRQIARLLGISESNVGTKLYRAVRKLRDCFKGWQE